MAIAIPARDRRRGDGRLDVPVLLARWRTREISYARTFREAGGASPAEIAACLAISPRQVERHLEQARDRAKATTTAQLVAMLVDGRLAPATQLGDRAADGT
jgi:DNA-binding CsgD family transcriptional regulator